MPFQYILANLLADTEGAVGVLFFDETGETVDLASSELAPYDLRVLGAYLGIALRQLRRALDDTGAGDPQLLHVERSGLHVYAVSLTDGYTLAVVQRPPALTARLRMRLTAAAQELERQVFASG
jgi:predicted regulator of Ras-like GTPase activity (Roadblock/LC7/MglB family)